jgi:succinyl-CoA synthetase beta subunit
VGFPDARRVAAAEETAAAAAEIGFPVVVKALGMVHKSDQGGVVLGLPDEEAVAVAAGRMKAKGFSVERMVSTEASAELIVGCLWDPRFGPVLLVGFGGILAEVIQDWPSPLRRAGAAGRGAPLGLRGAALLTGARGRAPLAVGRAAEAAAAISRVAAAHPELEALEVNPLLVTETEAIGLDARAIYSSRGRARRRA